MDKSNGKHYSRVGQCLATFVNHERTIWVPRIRFAKPGRDGPTRKYLKGFSHYRPPPPSTFSHITSRPQHRWKGWQAARNRRYGIFVWYLWKCVGWYSSWTMHGFEILNNLHGHRIKLCHRIVTQVNNAKNTTGTPFKFIDSPHPGQCLPVDNS